MNKLITDFYYPIHKSMTIKVYNGIVSYLKNTFSKDNVNTMKYTQKLITDYYKVIPKKNKVRQQLITEFYQ